MVKIEYMTNAFQSDLKPRARLVLHCLALHSNKEGQCFPSIKTIAKECGYSVNTIKRALDDLVESGFVVKEARFDTERKHGGQTSNLYTLNIVQSNDNQKEEPVMAEKQVIDIVTESKEEKADDIEDKTAVEKTNEINELGVALNDYCQNQRREKIERSYPTYNFTWAGEEPKGASP